MSVIVIINHSTLHAVVDSVTVATGFSSAMVQMPFMFLPCACSACKGLVKATDPVMTICYRP